MKQINFIKDTISYNPQNVFVAHLSGNFNNEDELFDELKSKLRFPHYFGFNWNAVYDCLRDFHWIDQKGIVIIHDEFSLEDNDLINTYLKVIVDATRDWKENEEHYLEIVFPYSIESQIRQRIKYSNHNQ